MIAIEEVWAFVREVLKTHKDFAMGHVRKKTVKGMTPLEMSVSLRKCGDPDCHCEVIVKDQFDLLLKNSDSPAEFLNRLWMSREANSNEYDVGFEEFLPFQRRHQ